MRDYIKEVLKINVIIVLILVLIFVIMQKLSFAAGILVGAFWSIANTLLTVKLIEIAILKKEKRKLLLLLLIKFPVLYLLGFFILIYKMFPVLSLLTGAISVFIAWGVFSLCQKGKKSSMNYQI